MQAHGSTAHSASVNSISFAPHELGLALVAASSDGSISVLTHSAEAGWQTDKVCICYLNAHTFWNMRL